MGYAEADITPQKPVELVGFFRPDNWSKGILRPLKLQVMLRKDSHRAGCLITVDSQWIKVLLLRVTMVQGAAGDIRPRFHQDNTEYLEIHGYEAAERGFSKEYRKFYIAQSEEALVRTAGALCGEVSRVLETVKTEPVVRMEMTSALCRLTGIRQRG